MANFSNFSDLLNTTVGMTAIRNNAAQDDGIDTIAGVDWFTFNGVAASNLYVSGNSFVGFGVNSEQLKICRRDCKMYYLYRQEGVIGNKKFLKIRWHGYAQYNQTASEYALMWELFLFDDGGIYLNITTVPYYTSYLGTTQLTCGSKTYNLTVSSSTPVHYSFLPDESGGFTVSDEEYPVLVNHVSNGYIEFSTDVLRRAGALAGSKITWEENLPEGTSLSVYSKVSSGSYGLCTNGSSLFGVKAGTDYSNETLFIKVEMSTNDPLMTPTLSNLLVQLQGLGDDHILVLSFSPGNITSIQNAVGDVSVAYDGSGTLKGLGGPVFAFDETFRPENLDPKNHPHDAEHIEVNVQAVSNLMRIYYTDSSETERVNVKNITAVGVLTHVDNI